MMILSDSNQRYRTNGGLIGDALAKEIKQTQKRFEETLGQQLKSSHTNLN